MECRSDLEQRFRPRPSLSSFKICNSNCTHVHLFSELLLCDPIAFSRRSNVGTEFVEELFTLGLSHASRLESIFSPGHKQIVY